MNRPSIMGVSFDALNIDMALERAKHLIKQDSPALIVTPNPEMLVNSSRNPELKQALQAADLVIADGIGVIYGAKLLKKPLTTRVTGVDLMTKILGFLSENKGSYFLFGSKPGVAEQAALNINKQFTGITCVGTHDGYFKAEDEANIIAMIAQAKPDVVFVGLGSPKQEIWAYKNLAQLNSTVCMCIGGAIDVYSGNVQRAPGWICKIGFEWLYRAVKEPKRFKRLLKIPVFLVKIFTVK